MAPNSFWIHMTSNVICIVRSVNVHILVFEIFSISFGCFHLDCQTVHKLFAWNFVCWHATTENRIENKNWTLLGQLISTILKYSCTIATLISTVQCPKTWFAYDIFFFILTFWCDRGALVFFFLLLHQIAQLPSPINTCIASIMPTNQHIRSFHALAETHHPECGAQS